MGIGRLGVVGLLLVLGIRLVVIRVRSVVARCVGLIISVVSRVTPVIETGIDHVGIRRNIIPSRIPVTISACKPAMPAAIMIVIPIPISAAIVSAKSWPIWWTMLTKIPVGNSKPGARRHSGTVRPRHHQTRLREAVNTRIRTISLRSGTVSAESSGSRKARVPCKPSMSCKPGMAGKP